MPIMNATDLSVLAVALGDALALDHFDVIFSDKMRNISFTLEVREVAKKHTPFQRIRVEDAPPALGSLALEWCSVVVDVHRDLALTRAEGYISTEGQRPGGQLFSLAAVDDSAHTITYHAHVDYVLEGSVLSAIGRAQDAGLAFLRKHST